MQSPPVCLCIMSVLLGGCLATESDRQPFVGNGPDGTMEDGVFRLNASGAAGSFLLLYIFSPCEKSSEQIVVNGSFEMGGNQSTGERFVLLPTAVQQTENPLISATIDSDHFGTEWRLSDAPFAFASDQQLTGFVQAFAATQDWSLVLEEILFPSECDWDFRLVRGETYKHHHIPIDASSGFSFSLPESGWTHVQFLGREVSSQEVRTFSLSLPIEFRVRDFTIQQDGGYMGPPGHYAGSFVNTPGEVSGSIERFGALDEHSIEFWHFPIEASSLPNELQTLGYCEGAECRVFPPFP